MRVVRTDDSHEDLEMKKQLTSDTFDLNRVTKRHLDEDTTSSFVAILRKQAEISKSATRNKLLLNLADRMQEAWETSTTKTFEFEVPAYAVRYVSSWEWIVE